MKQRIEKVAITFGRLLYAFPFLIGALLPFAVMVGGVLLFLSFLPMEAHAELQKFYNLSITIDRASEDGFNEKIEVYVEKNGEYYGDYDLNQFNEYLYKTDARPGTYKLWARVRYDQSGTYQVEPEAQELVIGDLDYKDMHTVTFQIIGGVSADDEDEDVHVIEETEPLDPNNVYSMDRIDELRAMQESAEAEASKAFQENEKWEQENNFIAKNGITDQGVPAESSDSVLPDHYYPDESEQNEVSTEAFSSEEALETEQETEVVILDTAENKSEKSSKKYALILIPLIVFGAVGLRIHFKKKNGDENGT